MTSENRRDIDKNLKAFLDGHGTDVARGYMMALQHFSEELRSILFKEGTSVFAPAQSSQKKSAVMYNEIDHMASTLKVLIDMSSNGTMSPKP